MELASAQRILDLTFEVSWAEDRADFRMAVARGVGKLVGADLSSYTEVELKSGQAFAVMDHPVADGDEIAANLGRLAHEHPLVVRECEQAETISDYYSARRFHSLELYHDVYRRLGAEDQIAINLPAVPGVAIGVALNRSRRSIGVHERELLDLLRPLLVKAHRRVLARERARELMELLQDAQIRTAAQEQMAVIAVDDQGRIEFASERAVAMLRSYFPRWRAGRLPEDMVRWLQMGAETPLVVAGAGARLQAHAMESTPNQPRLLELHERPLEGSAG